MYGVAVGTGTGGSALMIGMATGSNVLMVVAAACVAASIGVLARNYRRRAAHQRP